MVYTLGQAANAAGVSKTTLRRAIEKGRISAARLDDGSYAIDASELHRAFPQHSDGGVPVARSVTASDTGALRVEIDGLREQLALLKDERDDLRRRLDRADDERRQAQERLTALLTAPQPAARRSWWRRVRSKQ
jgi:excisionase family DNA binding protein